tara:strand:+ start:46829 stop:47560 length:732 start_codon:yes stop_codon:yes gene_type:complete
MQYFNLIRAGALGISCLALGACLGSSNGTAGGGGTGGGGGAGGGGKTPAEFDAKFNSITSTTSGLAPTSKELTGTATFSGVTKVALFEAADPTNAGEAFADLNVQVDFGGETISGQATNFEGTVGGNPVTLSGTLDSANSPVPSTLISVTTPLASIPGVPSIPGAPTSVTATSFSLNMSGELSDDDGVVGNVLMGMGGGFLGPIGGSEATAAAGPTTVVVTDVTGATGLIDIGGAGTFYLEKD